MVKTYNRPPSKKKKKTKLRTSMKKCWPPSPNNISFSHSIISVHPPSESHLQRSVHPWNLPGSQESAVSSEIWHIIYYNIPIVLARLTMIKINVASTITTHRNAATTRWYSNRVSWDKGMTLSCGRQVVSRTLRWYAVIIFWPGFTKRWTAYIFILCHRQSRPAKTYIL